MSNVFVAPKIKVGFQNRSDTFTGQLAYIIYYDLKGKLRKEKSWDSWRDHKIDPKEFDNVPTEGFTINKDIKRYSGEWFSSTRTMIRVHDPRGFEFEVTTENLIGILMHTDCLRRGLVGEFVYAWCGTDLVLLPTNSEEYQNAVKYTAGLGKKVSAKSLVPGVSYKTKREGNVIYIGRMNWYEYKDQNRYYPTRWNGDRAGVKVHVFTEDDGETFFKKSSAEFLAEVNSDAPVSNYAELVDKFNKKTYANKFTRFEFRPISFNPETKKTDWYGLRLVRDAYWLETKTPGIFSKKTVKLHSNTPRFPDGNGYDYSKTQILGYTIDDEDYYDNVGVKNGTTELVTITGTRTSTNYYYNSPHQRDCLSLDDMQKRAFYDLYIIYEDGRERFISNVNDLAED
jgi:hypothetical protein